MTFYQFESRSSSRSDALPVSVIVSFALLATIIAWSLAPGLFTSQDPYIGDTSQKLLSPGLRHWFGTDHLGRDVFARVVFGSWSSVTSAGIAVVIGLVFGGLLGLVSGFVGGYADVIVARLVDVLLAIPNFLLAVVIVSSFGFQTVNVAIATGASSVAVFARLMRAEALKTRTSIFVEASGLLGGSKWHILLRHVLPNAYRSVLALAVLQFGASILVIASLAFLGYGDPPPAADWGVLVSNGKDYPSSPWLVFAPASVIVVTVLSINRLSRWLRQSY
ncbi:ABC transporter permease [Agrobacterium rhizogenes]|uniref:ABC transporter permease protein n=1 Tax=Rhizobium rhizogenes (strain K84 / ATCC BAA-868) TaxID=311403 RepID=B9JQC7_RHIR8|nr:ABC transporter permease [Rhizobium rhizogenes]ACM31346.1 ABC transporter permease protein [Rhizobium rhizogenes K84]OCJ22058.1 peptide ABC transporter permease [Agrobacterium sp. B131/95]OCJ24425.1 peptide ABC transporter permease [Agrobacterium sp. B133/95]NTI46294.1 ABC transporter permease [Rhizobium rhizogenes]NTI52977.1 ABC transporter permease [Rhizobium rhizogenes]